MTRLGARGRAALRARTSAAVHAALAVICWGPLLATAPGRVAADTRQHLLIDPSGFMDRARSLWDPMVHLGTVTHQNLGLLVPMAPWYWMGDALGIPVWVTQRLWVGAILFAAAAGVLHLGRTLAWDLAGTTASAVVYALSPYVLQYATRTSVLLLPFAGLPWMLSLTIRAGRTSSWRHPALVALVVFLVGSVNATSLILVGIAPVLWLIYAAASGDVTARSAATTALRIGVLCAGVSAWWIAGMAVQSRYGLPVLTYTETIDDVATTAAAPEVLRGLGYWVFYGREVRDPNVGASVAYTQNPGLLALSYLIPAAALLAAVAVRFRQRGFFVLLAVIGVVVAVGAYPVGDAPPLAALFHDAASSTAGLALRSSTRAVPLVALSLAVFVGRGVTAVAARPRVRWRLVWITALAALITLPALFTGGFVDDNFSRPSELPPYWRHAADRLNDAPGTGSVLELPGIQFATYRWGTTYEPVTPALVDRPVVAREQLPYGSPASADLLIALDRRFQEGVNEPEALPAVARLLGADSVLLRNDLAFERYISARPSRLRHDLTPLPEGLVGDAAFGRGVENRPDPRLPLLDEEFLGLPPGADPPAAIELLGVDGARAALRLESLAEATIVDGDGEGIVDLAAAGLLPRDGAILYGATVLGSGDTLDEAIDGGANVVLTDTARKRVRRWRSVRWSTGYTERADEASLSAELGDADLEVFDETPPGAQTTTRQLGATVDATAYGGPFTLDPDVRPALALDGRPDTAWAVGPVSDAVGERLVVRPAEPLRTDHIVLLQRQAAGATDEIRSIEVRVNDGPTQTVQLDESSLTPPGQRIDLGGRVSVSELEIEIRGVRTVPGADPGASPVGLAEVGLGSLRVEEVVELPTALVDGVGPALDGNPLTVLLTRLRSDPAEPVRGDEEVRLRRGFELPGERSFSVSGSARLSAHAGGPAIDALVGAAGPTVRASSELPGSLASRASAAVDGDTETAWQPAFRDLDGAWLELSLDRPTRLDHLDLSLVADWQHSVPTELRVEVDGVAQAVSIPEVAPGTRPGTVRRVTVPLRPVVGQRIKVTATASRAQQTIDYYSRTPISLPFGIAELDVNGARLSPPSERFDTGCRDDLLTVDGRPVPIRVTGSTSDAIDRRGLDVAACGDLVLGAGAHELDAVDGAASGLDIDRLVLQSAGRSPAGPAPASTGSVEVTSRDATRLEARVDARQDAWLVLGQSHNDGWRARVDGEDLGAPTLVDGGFNGWRIPGASGAREVVVEWRPQRTVDRAILVTLAAVVVALVLAIADRRRRTPWQRAGDEPVAVGWAAPPVQWQPAAMVAVVLSMALVGLLVAGPAVAAAAAVTTLVLLRRPLGGLAVAAAILGLWLLAAGWIVVRQIVDPRRPDFEWIDDFGWPHGLALAAMVLLLTVAVTDVLRSRATPGPAELERAASAHAWLTGLARRSGPARALRRLQSVLPTRDGDRDERSIAEPRPGRRFAAASAAGGVLALLIFAWLLTLGRFDMTSWQRVGDFYDAQADAWLDGRWDIPPDTLGIERFEARGRSYMYQGPWPAVLRLPFAAVADGLDGRLTQLSMTLALGVAIAAAARLHWRIRRLLRGDAPVTRGEAVAVGLGTFAVAGGSALLYVASRAWVYHEALLWGVAWSIAALDAVLACVVEPTRRRVAWAGLATTLALCSRSSVALGPVAAMAVLAAGNLLARWHPRRRPDPSATAGPLDSLVRRLRWLGTAPRGRESLPVLGLALAAFLPLATYATVNWIKFRTLFSIPFNSQGFTIVDPARQEMLAANDGTLFGLEFAPTTLLQYLRPDALSFTRTFPFVDLPAPADPIGDVQFDLIDRSSSIPVAMTALLALCLIALVAAARRPPTVPGHGIAALRVPLLGAIFGALTIVPFGYIANRYLADAVPALTIGAAAGLQILLARVGDPRRRWVRPGLVALGVLVLAGTWINLSLALVYQRLYSPNVKDDVIAGFLDTTYDVAQSLALNPDVPISTGPELPATAPRGSLFAIGDCDALYISDAMDVNAVKVSPWNAVERTEAGGRHLRQVTFPERPVGWREPIMSVATPSGNGILFAEWRGGAGIAFAYEGPGVRQESPTRHVPAGRTWTMDLVVDPHVQVIQIWLDAELMLETYYRAVDGRPVIGRDVTGRDDIADTFGGTMDPLPERAGLCEELLGEADGR